MPMLLTDPRQEDNPIVFANGALLAMSQYTLDELLGRNCRLLQGPATDRDTVAKVREAIAQSTEIAVELLNYRKDGSTFWNAMFISPVFNHAGELVYFFGSQLDVSHRRGAKEALAQAHRHAGRRQCTRVRGPAQALWAARARAPRAHDARRKTRLAAVAATRSPKRAWPLARVRA